MSARGVQQADLLGPVSVELAIHPVLLEAKRSTDRECFFQALVAGFGDIGLSISQDKSEVVLLARLLTPLALWTSRAVNGMPLLVSNSGAWRSAHGVMRSCATLSGRFSPLAGVRWVGQDPLLVLYGPSFVSRR